MWNSCKQPVLDVTKSSWSAVWTHKKTPTSSVVRWNCVCAFVDAKLLINDLLKELAFVSFCWTAYPLGLRFGPTRMRLLQSSWDEIASANSWT
eukprot:12908931-Prorocentrum_lima.AAC.1